jgi:hypothetical protein
MPSSNAVINTQIFKNIDKLNNIINQASVFLTECQVGQPCYIEQLKAAYDKAKYDLLSDPDRVKKTRKEYIIAKYGEFEYNNMIKNEAYQQAESEILILIEEYINTLGMVYTQTNALNTAIEGSSYIDDVLIQTVSNNALKEQSNVILTNDILTNERKSYYEQDKYNDLKSWYRIWFWVYIFLWIIFSLSLFLTNNQYSYLSIMSKVGLVISFIIYLFIAKYIVLLIISFIVFSTTLFPKNIYLNM